MIHICPTSKFNLFSTSDNILNEMREKNIQRNDTLHENTRQIKINNNTTTFNVIKRKQKEIVTGPSKKYLKEREFFNERENENNEFFERLADEAEQQERQVCLFLIIV